ncbi:MAG: hypothetical protein H7Y86_13230 [Rhizobacter sp.]|nr:hypothetical protein [Ferruginibacter sp.]
MKKYLTLSVLLLFNYFICYAQNDSAIYLKGYEKTNYLRYFGSLHELKKASISNLEHSYYCVVVLKVDSTAKVTNLEIIEMPDAILPQLAKKYIESVFWSTQDKWVIENKNLFAKKPARSLFFDVDLLKINQSIDQRLKDYEKHMEFVLFVMPHHPSLKDYDPRHLNLVTLAF